MSQEIFAIQTKCREEVSTLRKELQILTTEIEHWQKSLNEKTQPEYKPTLQSEIDELRKRREILKKEREALFSRHTLSIIESMSQEWNVVVVERTNVHSTHRSLQTQLDRELKSQTSLQEEITELKKKYVHLTEQNKRLQEVFVSYSLITCVNENMCCSQISSKMNHRHIVFFLLFI